MAEGSAEVQREVSEPLNHLIFHVALRRRLPLPLTSVAAMSCSSCGHRASHPLAFCSSSSNALTCNTLSLVGTALRPWGLGSAVLSGPALGFDDVKADEAWIWSARL